MKITILTSSPYIHAPKGWSGWVMWVLLLTLVIISLYYWRGYNKAWTSQSQKGTRLSALWSNRGIFFLILLVLTPITSLFFGVTINLGNALPPPDLPLETSGSIGMVFSGIPWVLAGGILGPVPAAILALLSGVLLALWSTHSAFTPLVVTLMAILFSIAVNQRYRTTVYHLLRQPILAGLTIWLSYPIIFLVSAPFIVQGHLVIQIDYALSNLLNNWIAQGIVLLVATSVGQVVARFLPVIWGNHTPLVPSPAEKSLKTRFLYNVTPLAILLVFTLVLGSWMIAGAAARELLRNQMSTTAKTIAHQIPYFIKNGENLITQLAADQRLMDNTTLTQEEVLEDLIKETPFFTQLVLLDKNENLLKAYPDGQFTGEMLPPDERAGIRLALSGVPLQIYTVPPAAGSGSAQVSFVTPVRDQNQEIQGVLLGRTDLSTNPVSQPIVNGLSDMVELYSTSSTTAEGIVIDENNQIVIHPDPSLIGITYWGETDNPEHFFYETAPDGTRRLVYFENIPGSSWSVIIAVPTLISQQLALRIAGPLLVMIGLVSIISLVILNLSIRNVSQSLNNLASQADSIAKGNLEKPLEIQGEDEIGQLGRSFEKMRISLEARLDELNQLLSVSQGVSASLELRDSIQPVLDAILAQGASSARVVLNPAYFTGLNDKSNEPILCKAGKGGEFAPFDEKLLSLGREQGLLMIDKSDRSKIPNLKANIPYPVALIALALRQENQYLGVLWAAYDEPHSFQEEEIRFFTTLASQATIAVGNASHYRNAEIGRQRLAAILSSSPDPILVTDQLHRLILTNPAACQVLGIGVDEEINQPIEKLIHNPHLLELIKDPVAESHSTQVTIQPGRVYQALVSSVMAEGQWVGRVCVLHDVTQFKELDTLKTEFVSTVSHDLRTPLALMRGYATMVEMVGQLNEQQVNYMRKIVSGVENMSHLVNNLLDLGRIETGVGLQAEMVAADDIVERVISSHQAQAHQKKIQIKSEYSPQGADFRLKADPALLQQALHNLIENAIKFTRSEGKITVRVQVQPHRMVFEVSDTGIGISPVDQPRIFEKFYQGPQPGSSEGQGSGLGLAIVRTIAERHNGQVWVESQLGKGSSFFIAIPIQQPGAKIK